MTSDEPSAPPANGGTLARLEHLQHWWREPLAGFVAVGLASFDVWRYGRDAGGFTSSLDEILILSGVALIAGVRNLFAARPGQDETDKR